MLKLKKVQILGFKSFCDRTEVQLAGHGIAAIVGPNGCGKSNISDAITWVLGEQSAKSLRGVKMEDVIFAGTRERKPTGMAEVSLTLVDPEIYDGTEDISGAAADVTIDSRQAPDWNEQELREQRAAETEEAVAEAQPGAVAETAEALGEAAADTNSVVLKIRRRKFGRTPIRAGEITVTRRLFRSGDSEYLLNGKICRLRDIQDDIFDEVTKQMATLKRQAAKAERYGQIRDELRAKLRVVLASRLAQLDAEQTAASHQIASLTVEIDAQAAQIEAMDAEHTEGVRHGYTLDGQVRAHAAVASQSAVALERIAARTAAKADRVAELTARLGAEAASEFSGLG